MMAYPGPYLFKITFDKLNDGQNEEMAVFFSSFSPQQRPKPLIRHYLNHRHQKYRERLFREYGKK